MDISKKKSKHDISHIVTVALGVIVLVQCSMLLTLLYIVISVLGLVWFLARICPHCRAFNSLHCRSGYGRLSAKMFKRPAIIDFRRAFKRNIVSVAFQWFIPFFAGMYCLYVSFNYVLFITCVLFMVVAFVWLPLTSRKKGCRECPQRNDCGWVSK